MHAFNDLYCTVLQINALLSIYHLPNDDVPEVSEEVHAVVKELTKKIDSAVSKYDEGAFIKMNTHSPKDAILDRYDADHIQDVEVRCFTKVHMYMPLLCE